MMSNLETLTAAKSGENVDEAPAPTSPPPKRATPDLVQDLPLVTADVSPVGSYREESSAVHSPPALTDSAATAANETAVEATVSTDLNAESSAETFANSDGTIVRIKSASLPQAPPKFITASIATKKELSSFRRSVSTSSAPGYSDSLEEPEKVTKPRVPSVTGRAIQVKAPSIPTSLNINPKLLSQEKTTATTAPQSPPSSPDTTPPFPKTLPKLISDKQAPPTTTTKSLSQSEGSGLDLPVSSLAASFEKKFSKPPPPIKAKPKPPAPPPKPKK